MRRILTAGLCGVLLTTGASLGVADDKFDNAWPEKREYADPGITRAMEAVRAGIADCRDDHTRPVYHFRPPAHWMNDVCGTIYHKGYYHLCYMINPFGDQVSRMEIWGHARSKDMVRWEHLPIPFWPNSEPWEDGIYTGGAAINGHGQPMFFWTANPRRGSGLKRTAAAAVSDDRMVLWKKCPENPMLRRGTHGDPKFDGGWDAPFLFTEKGRTFVIFGAILGDESVVPIYEALNPQLTRWAYRGILFRKSKREVSDLECQNFLKLGDQWMLCYSPDGRQMRYHVGPFDLEKFAFTPRVDGILDHAFGKETGGMQRGFYASNVLYTPDGRCVIFAWVSGFRSRGWNGCVSLPRVVTLGPDGHPRQAPAVELQKLRGKHVRLEGLTLNDQGRVLDGVRGDTLEILAKFEPGDAKSFGLDVRRSDDGKSAVTLRYDGRAVNVAGTNVPLELAEGEDTLDLHVFLDRSVMEVFINGGRRCVTRVVYPGAEDQGVRVFSQGGKTRIKSIDVWQIKSIW